MTQLWTRPPYSCRDESSLKSNPSFSDQIKAEATCHSNSPARRNIIPTLNEQEFCIDKPDGKERKKCSDGPGGIAKPFLKLERMLEYIRILMFIRPDFMARNLVSFAVLLNFSVAAVKSQTRVR